MHQWQLLQSVRYYTDPPGSTFFAPLDAILENYHPHASDSSTLNRGDVLEVQGPAGSGKTSILHFLAMTTCLPRSWSVALSVRGSSRPPRIEDIAIGGRSRSVAVVDCNNGRFSIERLYRLVHAHLERRVQEHAGQIPALYSATAPEEDLHKETIKALARVHVFNPTSSVSLAATLLQLPLYSIKACASEILFVLVDGMSAFYWQDRYAQEQEHSSRREGKPKIPSLSKQPMQNVIHALKTVREKLGCVTVLTNWAFPSGNAESDSHFYRQHLQRPYPSPFLRAGDDIYPLQPEFFEEHPFYSSSFAITHHLTLRPAEIKPVPVEQGFDVAEKEEKFRFAEQQDKGSTVYVRLPGIENGDCVGMWELVNRANGVEGL